jgi:tubulysin polyketide synthase-like protein
MRAEELIQQVQAVGGRILVNGGRLRIRAPKGTISPDLTERLRERKPEIVRRLELEASMGRLCGAPENAWEWIEERAAILEIGDLVDRDTASYRAFLMWFECFVGRPAQTK